MKIYELYHEGINTLKKAGIDDPEYDARELLKAAFDFDTGGLLISMQDEISSRKGSEGDDSRTVCFRDLIRKRADHEPLQHILGYCYFMGLKMKVNPDALIPRQETETLCELVLSNEKNKNISILDLGSGSGCIAISLKKIGNYGNITASDISKKALLLAKRNALLNGVNIKFVQSNLFNNLKDSFDVIVSNPPYVKSKLIETLAPEVRDYDPNEALDGGIDGLVFYRKILAGIGARPGTGAKKIFLKPGGRLYMEIGYDQAEPVRSLMKDAGYEDIQVFKDLSGLDRVIYGRKKN